MNNIEKSIYHLKSLYESLNSKVPVNLDNEITYLTKLSYEENYIENLVNIINLERKTIDISNYNYLSDYTISTFNKYTTDGLYFINEVEYNNFISDKYDYPLWEDLDIEYDEIYNCIVFNFGDSVSINIAEKVGLGVLVLNSTGEKFLFFKGSGMDMSHLVIEYLALVYGGITVEYLNKLTYCKSVLSKDKFNDLIQLLGVDASKLNQ